MKRKRLSHDEWKTILSRELRGKEIHTELIDGYIGVLSIQKVTAPQIWECSGRNITVCRDGTKWLSILPKDDFYCITAMMDENNAILLWYIDMIAGQGVDVDGVRYFDDLYLDLVVYPDGSVQVDDRDELEDALARQDITPEQFHLALHTAKSLMDGLLRDVNAFRAYTYQCYQVIAEEN